MSLRPYLLFLFYLTVYVLLPSYLVKVGMKIVGG